MRPAVTATAPSPLPHLGIAEQGKLHALRGEHDLALSYYRIAMQFAGRDPAGGPGLRHYAECVVECLEAMGSYAEVLEYCRKAAGHYAANPPAGPVQALDLATIEQREGCILMKLGRTADAAEALRRAVARAEAAGGDLPLARRLLGWIEGRVSVPAERITDLQRRLHYYAVRPETVDRKRAVALPPAMLRAGTQHGGRAAHPRP